MTDEELRDSAMAILKELETAPEWRPGPTLKFDIGALTVALGTAQLDHDATLVMREYQVDMGEAAIQPILGALKRADRLWKGLLLADRQRVLQYISSDEVKAAKVIERRLTYLVDLFEEYQLHFARGRGNPGWVHARVEGEERGNTDALIDFVLPLMDFWHASGGGDTRVDAERDTDQNGPLIPGAPFGWFVFYAAQKVLDVEYTASALETAVRNARRRKPKSTADVQPPSV